MKIKLFIFLSAAVVIFIGRLIIRTINKASQGGSINKIKKNPALADGYADGLDFPYNRKECDPDMFKLMRQKVLSSTSIGTYKILYAVDAGSSRVLVFTELSYVGLNFNVAGHVGDSKEKAFHDFVVVFNPVKSEVQVYSSMFDTVTDKFQKEEFLKSILVSEVVGTQQ